MCEKLFISDARPVQIIHILVNDIWLLWSFCGPPHWPPYRSSLAGSVSLDALLRSGVGPGLK